MIKIIAQTNIADPEEDAKQKASPFLPAKEQIPAGMTPSQDIPLADDDLEEIIPTSPMPPPQPSGVLESVPEADVEPVPDFPSSQELPQQEPKEEEQTPFPEQEFEEITEEETELDRLNYSLTIQQKIDKSLAEGNSLRIIYTTLKGHTSERTVRPDYYRPARTTGNWVLIAWCELRQDWRGFIVDRIRAAKLEPTI